MNRPGQAVSALGAVMASLYGIFGHEHDWDCAYEYWHIARPLTGATLGVIAFLIFVVVVNASTASGQPPPPTAQAAPPAGKLVYYLIAFVVGYREQTFQTLIKRVTDLLLSPLIPDHGDDAGPMPGKSEPSAGTHIKPAAG